MKILNKLTIKHLTLNKKRTITTILGICLSTALMVGIGLLFSTIREEYIKIDLAEKGRYIIKYTNVPSEKIDFIDANNEVKDYYYTSSLGLHELKGVEEGAYKFIEAVEGDENFFKELKLISGVLPKKSDEVVVPNHLVDANKIRIEVGKTIDLEIKNEEKTIIKTYKVVGIVEKTPYENYYGDAYQVYSLMSNESKNLTIYINVKNLKNTYKLSETLVKNLELLPDDISINDTMLSMYGVSKYSNIINSMAGIMAIVLSLIAVGCIVVIYNSFAISVMERKKQFGLFASIGTTRKQLRYTVFFEAMIVGLIGIPLGILSAYIGIGIVILVINNLLEGVFVIPLELATYWLFVIIPVVFMIITVLLSAFIPAKQAAKTSPISAIRQNDDIKISGKKVKTNKLILKTFGVEGDIAIKNIKRNKKKYRITILSLMVSIILFISFSSLLEYGMKSSTDVLEVTEYNFMASYYTEDADNAIIDKMNKLRKNPEVEGSLFVYNQLYYEQSAMDKSFYTKDFLSLMEQELLPYDDFVEIMVYSEDDYKSLKEKYDVKDDVPFLINHYEFTSYKDSKRKKYTGKKYKDDAKVSITLTSYDKKIYEFNNIKLVEDEDYLMHITSDISNTLIINQKMLNDMFTAVNAKYPPNYHPTLTMKIKNYEDVEKQLKELQKESVHFDYINLEHQSKLMRNLIIVIEILLYGFIALVTLIGVTSVFNTINTSMNLRRKEFATLRSIGLSPKGFNKMLYLESIFFGLKSLIYALPISTLISYLIHKSLQGTIEFAYIFPLKPVIIAIFSVFIIVISNMMYSTHKIKHENILEAIREENI